MGCPELSVELGTALSGISTDVWLAIFWWGYDHRMPIQVLTQIFTTFIHFKPFTNHQNFAESNVTPDLSPKHFTRSFFHITKTLTFSFFSLQKSSFHPPKKPAIPAPVSDRLAAKLLAETSRRFINCLAAKSSWHNMWLICG